MTKLRKLTALLLAGALTLLLLTACSGGGSSGPEAQAEAKVMSAIRSNSSTKNLEYDVGMCNIAKDELAKTNLRHRTERQHWRIRGLPQSKD